MEDSQISEYESRTFLRRTQRYFAKGFRRNRARKVAYVVLSGLQLLLFCFFAIVFPWIIDGESISQQFTPEEKYFSAIISLSGGFCFVFGLSSILRSNIFEMIAATMMVLLLQNCLVYRPYRFNSVVHFIIETFHRDNRRHQARPREDKIIGSLFFLNCTFIFLGKKRSSLQSLL